MTKNNSTTAMRRKDRRITDTAEIHTLLAHADLGFLAIVAGNQPLATPYSFWFDGEHIYFHGAKKGQSKEIMQQNPRVCFTVAERGRYLPAKRAMDFSVEYASVMVFGRGRMVTTKDEQIYALQGLMDKYFPHLKSEQDYAPIIEKDLRPTGVYAVDIESMSGKRKAAPDHSMTGKLRAFFSLDEVME